MPNLHKNAQFAHQTFDFLKMALSFGEKVTKFQPRGPKKFISGDWKYLCVWAGGIEDFKGHEKIFYKGKVVFTHDFNGGLFVYREN